MNSIFVLSVIWNRELRGPDYGIVIVLLLQRKLFRIGRIESSQREVPL